MKADDREITGLLVCAFEGFINAIPLGRRKNSASVLQDMLCLINLWFKFGNRSDVNGILTSGLSKINWDAWLGVVPQLIARIQVSDSKIQLLLQDLLTRLGLKHPQALVYPLSVALKSPRVDRREAAKSLMLKIKAENRAIVAQALLVSTELIKVCNLRHEMCHGGLEEASRLYFGDGDVLGMLEILIKLHNELLMGARTEKEAFFQEKFGRDLGEALDYLQIYQKLMAVAGERLPPAVINELTSLCHLRHENKEKTSLDTFTHKGVDGSVLLKTSGSSQQNG